MKKCKVCGRPAKFTKRLGPARPKGFKMVVDSVTGKKKLPKCTGPVEYFCREHSGKAKKSELSGRAKKLGKSYPRKEKE